MLSSKDTFTPNLFVKYQITAPLKRAGVHNFHPILQTMLSHVSRTVNLQGKAALFSARARFATVAAGSTGFANTVEFAHAPLNELRWAVARDGVQCRQNALLNPTEAELTSEAKGLSALKEAKEDQTARFSVVPSSNSIEMDEETFEEVLADAQATIGKSNNLFVMDKGVGSLFGLGTRIITEDPRMAKTLSSVLLQFPKRSPLNFEHPITVYASPEVDELSGGLAISAANASKVVIRGPLSLGHVQHTIASVAAKNFADNGKLVLGCNAYADGSSVRLVCGESKPAKDAVASGHIVWGAEGVTSLWNEPKSTQNIYGSVSELKIVSAGSKKSKKGSTVSAEEAADLIAQFLPSGGSEVEKEVFATLIGETKVTVAK